MKYIWFILCILLTACHQPEKTTLFKTAVIKVAISGNKIKEASGLVASVNNPGMLWTHNDSGNASDIFLLDSLGNIRCTVHLADIKNRDWEDIAVGSGPEAGKQYIYVADIGDNKGVYEEKIFYRIEEPGIAERVTDTTITHVDKVKFKLSDGARDSEALMIDPVSNNFYVFSKRESQVNLYKITGPLSTRETMKAERSLEGLPFTLIVAADISADGSEILAKNYDRVFYWKRNPGETVEQTVARTPEELSYEPEPQGESIAFSRSGKGYYTLSERKGKEKQHLYFYSRK